jgi:hypothetical protein
MCRSDQCRQFFGARLSIADLFFVSADKRQTYVAAAIGLSTRIIA